MGQTKESMNRDYLNFHDARKMMPISKVLAGLSFLTIGYKVIDAYVT